MPTADKWNNADPWHAVLHLLERAERRLARAVTAAHAADQGRLIHELAALALLAHLSTNVARSIEPSLVDGHDP